MYENLFKIFTNETFIIHVSTAEVSGWNMIAAKVEEAQILGKIKLLSNRVNYAHICVC